MAVPALSCPAVATALASTGVAPGCTGATTVSVVGGVVGSAVSGLAGLGVDSVLGALGSWVAAGASWVLGQVGAALSATTSPDLDAAWFASHYATMAALCGVVIVPLLVLGIIQSLARQSASLLLRSLLVNVPLALLLTAVAVKLVDIGLSVTDAMSQTVSGGSGSDVGHALTSIGADLTASGVLTGSPAVPAFVVFLGSLVVIAGAMALWLELLIRSAAVEVAVLFLPLALASLAWPAISHWCRRLVDTLAAVILSKFAIVAVLSLAVSAVAGGLGWAPSGADPSSGGGSGGSGGFAAVFTGAAMLLLAAFMPFALLRLLPMVEAGAVSHLEAIGARAHSVATAPVKIAGGQALRAAVGPLVGSAVAEAASSDPLPGIDGPGPGFGPGGGSGGGGPHDLGAGDGAGGEPDSPDLPEYPFHPEATAGLRQYLDGLAADPGGDEGGGGPPTPSGSDGEGSAAGALAGGPTGSDPLASVRGPGAGSPGGAGTRPVPLTGAGSPGWRPPRHRISSDHLGPKLVMIDPDEPDPPAPPVPPVGHPSP